MKILVSQIKTFKLLVIQLIEYKYNPSIILINKKVNNQKKFSFEPVALGDAVKEIKEINPNKS